MNVIKIVGIMNTDKPYLFNRVMDIQKSVKVAGKYMQPSGDVILKPHDNLTLLDTIIQLTRNSIKYLEVKGDE